MKDKELLLKDLCGRLPYGIKVCSPDKKVCSIWSVPTISVVSVINGSGQSNHPIENIKPYLRPMSSMTEEECSEYLNIKYNKVTYRNNYKRIDVGRFHNVGIIPIEDYLDWFNAHHFDYNGLIEKGLALEAPEGMYK